MDYDNARYYDPATGMFLSADDVQGDAQGMNPYAYVAGNPETYVDPSGQMITNNEVEVVDGVGPTNGSGVDLGELVTVLSAIGLAIQAHTPHAPHNPRFGNYGQHPSPGSSSSSSAPTVPSTDPCATLCSLSPSTNPSEGEGDSGFGNAIADAAVAAADAITDAVAAGSSGNQPPKKPVSVSPTPPDDERPPRPKRPPIPGASNTNEFGTDVIKWGGSQQTGETDALLRMFTITPEELAQWVDNGLTSDIATQWSDFYDWIMKYRLEPNGDVNQSALGRRILMAFIAAILKQNGYP